MPWFKVDDGFHGHPKVDMLSPASVGIWTLCGSHCAQYLTDGKVFARTVAKFGGTDAEVSELVNAGLWEDNGDGTYQFKDWGDYQPMRADVEAKRDAARERMRQAREAKNGSRNVRANTSRTSREVRSTPTRPDPSISNGDSDDFDAWYSGYPKKVAKGAAKKAFETARKKVDLDTLTKGRDAYVKAVKDADKKFIKNPATWLNGECWDDEYETRSEEVSQWDLMQKWNTQK